MDILWSGIQKLFDNIDIEIDDSILDKLNDFRKAIPFGKIIDTIDEIIRVPINTIEDWLLPIPEQITTESYNQFNPFIPLNVCINSQKDALVLYLVSVNNWNLIRFDKKLGKTINLLGQNGLILSNFIFIGNPLIYYMFHYTVLFDFIKSYNNKNVSNKNISIYDCRIHEKVNDYDILSIILVPGYLGLSIGYFGGSVSVTKPIFNPINYNLDNWIGRQSKPSLTYYATESQTDYLKPPVGWKPQFVYNPPTGLAPTSVNLIKS